MKVKWDFFSRRRRIKLEDFVKKFSSYEEVAAWCTSRSIEPPPEADVNAILSPPAPKPMPKPAPKQQEPKKQARSKPARSRKTMEAQVVAEHESKSVTQLDAGSGDEENSGSDRGLDSKHSD